MTAKRKSGQGAGPARTGGSAAHAEIRRRLLARKAELQKQVIGLESDQRRTGNPLSADFAEQASERENDDVIDALLLRARAELADINRALRSIETGRYGRCARCGDDIEAPRLAAVPSTDRCGACADAA